jgi:ribonuclease HI
LKVFSCAAENLQDFTLSQQEGQCEISHQEQDKLSATKIWQPPPPDLIKVNWDAATNIKEGCIGIGIVARDCGGHVLGAKSMYFPMVVDAKTAEAMAAIHAVLFRKDAGFLDVIFERDALQVVQEMNSKPPYASRIGHYVESFQHERVGLRYSTFAHAYRETNGIAHALVRHAISCKIDNAWLEDTPPFILAIVTRELVVPRP